MEVRMKRFATMLMLMFAGGAGPVAAQTSGAAPAAEEHQFYGELAGAATLGHKSATSFGLEGGYRLTDEWQVFAEGGRMANVATADLDQRAQNFATGIGASGVSAVQRAIYFDVGARYQPAWVGPYGKWRPYGLVGLGFASVKTSTTFGPSSLGVSYNLGNDLHSTLTKVLLTLGAGVTLPVGGRYLVDISYRYGRIFPRTSEILDDPGINTQRVQAGIAVKF
jgi:opacity protein-like surface antigen